MAGTPGEAFQGRMCETLKMVHEHTALSSALALTVPMANGPSYTTAIKQKEKSKDI